MRQLDVLVNGLSLSRRLVAERGRADPDVELLN